MTSHISDSICDISLSLYLFYLHIKIEICHTSVSSFLSQKFDAIIWEQTLGAFIFKSMGILHVFSTISIKLSFILYFYHWTFACFEGVCFIFKLVALKKTGEKWPVSFSWADSIVWDVDALQWCKIHQNRTAESLNIAHSVDRSAPNPLNWLSKILLLPIIDIVCSYLMIILKRGNPKNSLKWP